MTDLYKRSQIQANFSKAAKSYDEAAVLQKLTATELDSRLELVALEVNKVLDLGAGTGFLTEKLQARYPKAEISAVDLSAEMLEVASARLAGKTSLVGKIFGAVSGKNSKLKFIQADANKLPFEDASFDLVTTNFMLQWCDDLDAVLQEIRRVTRPGGLLMLSSLGPDTLKELRSAWCEVEGEAGHERLNQFVDMHDLGDALIRAGFGQPVMDVQHYTLTYRQPIEVMRDLQAIGATNANKNRTNALLGRQKFSQMLACYEKQRVDEKIPATFEIVHGHAWAAEEIIKGPNRNKDGVYEVTLDQISTIQNLNKQLKN